MSLKSWKAEFYPIPASEVPKEQAVAHSLQKWRGLRKENLERHGVVKYFAAIFYRTKRFGVGGDSCALCEHFFKKEEGVPEPCMDCPLFAALGTSCSAYDKDEVPYSIWVDTGNPEPMIAALEKAEGGK